MRSQDRSLMRLSNPSFGSFLAIRCGPVAAFHRFASFRVSKWLPVATRERHHGLREPIAELSIRGYAKHRGCSHTAVEKAIQQGRIRTTASGLINPEEADRDWSRNTAAKREPTQPSITAGGGSVPSYSQSRAIREAYLARLAKLDYEKRSGKLVDAEEVARAITTLAMGTRDGLLAIPTRIAPILAAETDERQVYQILDE
jgi:hypothetical protein